MLLYFPFYYTANKPFLLFGWIKLELLRLAQLKNMLQTSTKKIEEIRKVRVIINQEYMNLFSLLKIPISVSCIKE